MNDEQELRKTFVSILSRGRKANTYKFALARCILDHIQRTHSDTIQEKISSQDSINISYDDLAENFLKYYWHQECKYRIVQNFDPKKIPRVISIIREVFGNEYQSGTLGDLKKDPKNNNKLKLAKDKIRDEVFIKSPEVVPRFQNIMQGGIGIQKELFYINNPEKKQIELKFSALDFLNKNQMFLINTITLEWAKFLEKTNTLPRLIAKIDTSEKKRTGLRKYIKIFKDFDHCFYCKDMISGFQKHVDHFIPWSYIFEDDAWNLVISCQKCNCKKRDSLPNKEYLEKLIERNYSYKKQIQKLKESLIRIDTHKGWEKEIKNHYSSCKEYGFTQIPLP
ncbi:MAG: HNH endonuclease signature motif containing protein [Candidatus Nitrosoabyssus spongiisocia]|nr:MAG: HNH endonuclease signature motif containing protein [Nitrosopumilaceae archaeon AB1(1)]